MLKEELPTPCLDRPFVCDGLPEASNVMLIGDNPGQPTEKDWWEYWDEKTGFGYDDFLADYSKKKG